MAAYRNGRLSKAELAVWAANFPDEAPTINGELAWLSFNLIDND